MEEYWFYSIMMKDIFILYALLAKAGIAHNDVKLDNIFMKDGKITFGDFGNSADLEGLIDEDAF